MELYLSLAVFAVFVAGVVYFTRKNRTPPSGGGSGNGGGSVPDKRTDKTDLQ